MEEAAELADYLPLTFMSRRDGIPWDKTPKEQEYIELGDLVLTAGRPSRRRPQQAESDPE